MSWINTLRTSAEDFGTLAENNSSTGYEPNDHFTTEAYVEYTQESLGEQQFPDDFDYDDGTIGQTLLHACRRRADHSEEEGLSSCLSSPVSHDRTGKPGVCRLVSSRWRAYHSHDEGLSSSQSSSVGHRTGRPVADQFDSQIWNVRENPRPSSENEQLRILLERHREQISLIVEQRFKNTNSKPITTEEVFKSWMKQSSNKKEKFVVLIKETNDADKINNFFMNRAKLGSPWSSWDKSQWNGRIEAISRFHIRHNCEKKIGRRSRYYPWTHWQDTGIEERN